MASRVQQWIADTHQWSTSKHLTVAAVLIVAAAVAASSTFATDDTEPVARATGEPIPTTTPAPPRHEPTTPPSTVADHSAPVTVAVTSSTDVGTEGAASVTSPASPAATALGLKALDVLETIPVELEDRSGGYKRDLFAVWMDADHDGCDTRDEVLLTESLLEQSSETPGCVPNTGLWFSEYDNEQIEDASQLDVDHLVSLKEAWDSGASAWTPARRIAYANDLTDQRTLIAVSSTSNRSKGDRDPSNWLPDEDSMCEYVAGWIAVKARWSLSMDQSEHGRLKNILKDRCIDQAVEPWIDAPK